MNGTAARIEFSFCLSPALAPPLARARRLGRRPGAWGCALTGVLAGSGSCKAANPFIAAALSRSAVKFAHSVSNNAHTAVFRKELHRLAGACACLVRSNGNHAGCRWRPTRPATRCRTKLCILMLSEWDLPKRRPPERFCIAPLRKNTRFSIGAVPAYRGILA